MEVRSASAGLAAPPRVRPESRLRIPEYVVYRDFPAQTVVLNLRTGKYHGLNPTAGRMLAALERSSSVAAAARAIADRYSEPQANVERDLCELCAKLLDRGLIERVGDSGG
jgi:coenzyme PQQ synthesis protein D (PqqD)